MVLKRILVHLPLFPEMVQTQIDVVLINTCVNGMLRICLRWKAIILQKDTFPVMNNDQVPDEEIRDQ